MALRKKIVLLVGAGSSSLAGLTTLKSILDAIQGVKIPLDSQDPTIELVRDAWKSVKGQKGDNATLEDLLGLLKMYSGMADVIKGHHVFSNELKANLPHVISGHFKMRWENALAFCFQLMIDNYGPHKVQVTSEGFQVMHKILRHLAKANGGRLHLFTTNYDCLFNVMASKVAGLNFYSHISNSDGFFSKEWHVINKLTLNKVNPNIYIHRLHGCIAWFADQDSPYRVHEVYGSGESLNINDQNKLNQMAIKLITDEEIGKNPAFSLAFQELCDELAECDALLVWGHSFRDTELLRNIIKVAENRQNNPFNLYFIDPYLEEKDVIENMRAAIAKLPAVSSSVLKPKKINWVTQDKLDALVEAFMSFIKR